MKSWFIPVLLGTTVCTVQWSGYICSPMWACWRLLFSAMEVFGIRLPIVGLALWSASKTLQNGVYINTKLSICWDFVPFYCTLLPPTFMSEMLARVVAYCSLPQGLFCLILCFLPFSFLQATLKAPLCMRARGCVGWGGGGGDVLDDGGWQTWG